MTEFHRATVDEPPEYDMPPPPSAEEVVDGVDPQAPPPAPTGTAVPAPAYVPTPPQPQLLGYDAEGHPLYGYPARVPMSPIVKTALGLAAGFGLALLLQMGKSSKA